MSYQAISSALFLLVGTSLLASQFFNSVTLIFAIFCHLLQGFPSWTVATMLPFNAHALPTVFSNYAKLSNEYELF